MPAQVDEAEPVTVVVVRRAAAEEGGQQVHRLFLGRVALLDQLRLHLLGQREHGEQDREGGDRQVDIRGDAGRGDLERTVLHLRVRRAAVQVDVVVVEAKGEGGVLAAEDDADVVVAAARGLVRHVGQQRHQLGLYAHRHTVLVQVAHVALRHRLEVRQEALVGLPGGRLRGGVVRVPARLVLLGERGVRVGDGAVLVVHRIPSEDG